MMDSLNELSVSTHSSLTVVNWFKLSIADSYVLRNEMNLAALNCSSMVDDNFSYALNVLAGQFCCTADASWSSNR